MKEVLALLFAAALFGQTPPPFGADDVSRNRPSDPNVNSRYTVESINIANQRRFPLSKPLLDDIHHLVGARFNSTAFQSLAERISNELHGYKVVFKLARGADPDHVRVTFEIDGPKRGFDVSLPKLMYHSREGWSGEADAVATIGANAFTFGVLSDGDALVERFAGIRARYERASLGSGRVRLSFEFDSYHEQFTGATRLAAADGNELAGLYRARRNFEPAVTLQLTESLAWTAGFSFQQLQEQFPAARTESANAVTNTLRFERRWDNSGTDKQRLEAGYDLRTATGVLGADFTYARHAVHARYSLKHGRQSFDVSFGGGAIFGRAPLFERFVLGTSTTLRGWNKYDLAPLGGNRVVYGSIGYGYGIARLFYDAGSVWDRGTSASSKSSAGLGVKVEGILLAVAFPIRSDRVEPVFIAGMSF